MKETLVIPMKFFMVSEGLMKIDRIGAGVGIIIFNSAKKIAGGMHVLRAQSPDSQSANPEYYANTVIPYAMEQFRRHGAMPPFSVAVAGGASMMNMPQRGDMGSKLLQTVKDSLAKEHLSIKLEQTGGSCIRTIMLNVDAGKIKID